MEKYVYQFISSDEMIDEVDFYSLKEDIQEDSDSSIKQKDEEPDDEDPHEHKLPWEKYT